MKASAWIVAAAGIAMVASAAFSQWLPENKSRPVKPGLWTITETNNWGMFVTRNDLWPLKKRAHLSEAFLKHPFYARICLDARLAKQPDFTFLKNPGCGPAVVHGHGNIVTLDAKCHGARDGSRAVHAVYRFESSKHLVVDVTKALDPEAGYPAIERWDMHWTSAGCGALRPGEIRRVAPQHGAKR